MTLTSVAPLATTNPPVNSQVTSNTNHIDQLPPEIIRQILSYLPDPQSIQSTACVSKAWNKHTIRSVLEGQRDFAHRILEQVGGYLSPADQTYLRNVRSQTYYDFSLISLNFYKRSSLFIRDEIVHILRKLPGDQLMYLSELSSMTQPPPFFTHVFDRAVADNALAAFAQETDPYVRAIQTHIIIAKLSRAEDHVGALRFAQAESSPQIVERVIKKALASPLSDIDFLEITQAALQLPNRDFLSEVVPKIAKRFIEKGKLELGLRVALGTPTTGDITLKHLIENNSISNTDELRIINKFAQRIPNSCVRSDTLQTVVKQGLDLKEVDISARIAGSIPRAPQREEMLSLVAQKAVELGDFSLALDCANEIELDFVREALIAEIGQAQARTESFALEFPQRATHGTGG